jgi:cytochrome c5
LKVSFSHLSRELTVMSDNHNTTDHAEDHTGPIKTPKQLLLAIVYSFVVPVFAIIGLAYVVSTAFKPVAGAVDLGKSIEQRIAKVGTVEIKDTNGPLKSGEEVYKAQCVACHGSGAAGAPKYQDKGAWGARIGKGYTALLTSALKGKGSMGAQGGGDFDDIEIGRAVVFMANAGGAKLPVPDRPAAPAAK